LHNDGQSVRGAAGAKCPYAIYSLLAVIQHNLHHWQRPTFVAFIDYTTTFPSVLQHKLLCLLFDNGIVNRMRKHLCERFCVVYVRVTPPALACTRTRTNMGRWASLRKTCSMCASNGAKRRGYRSTRTNQRSLSFTNVLTIVLIASKDGLSAAMESKFAFHLRPSIFSAAFPPPSLLISMW
jgi:hypothetical protein